MKRGDIWTVAGGAHFTGKPRPAIIIQSDAFHATRSITICPCTTNVADAREARVTIAPTPGNGLEIPSFAMADKISTVVKDRLGRRIGRLDANDLARLDRAIIVFLGLADHR